MTRRLLQAALLSMATLLAACAASRVYYLTDARFSPRGPDEEVKLYVNNVQRPHVRIAHVQSFSNPSAFDPDVKTLQLKDLVARARRLGADAIVNVRQLRNEVQGAVQDPLVPFPSLQQGETRYYFFRGTAIKYTDGLDSDTTGTLSLDSDSTATLSADGETSPTQAGATVLDIPLVETDDPEADEPSDISPRGLGIVSP